MRNVDICIPWFDTGCPHRRHGMEVARQYWLDSGLNPIYGEGPSRSKARNSAVAKGTAPVLFLVDADTYVPIDQMNCAADWAAQTGRLVHAYTDLVRQAPAAPLFSRNGHTFSNPPSGAFAITRAAYEAVGGHDERYTGWGGEDQSFLYSCEALLGRGDRVQGRAYHVWHPNARDREGMRLGHNQTLFLRYKEAGGWEIRAGKPQRSRRFDPNPDAIMAILSEPGGPLCESVQARSSRSCPSTGGSRLSSADAASS